MKSKSRKCIICGAIFFVKYPGGKVTTCGKECKNEVARQNTISFFSKSENREKWSIITKEAMKDVDMKALCAKRLSTKGDKHPLWGTHCSEERKAKIGNANRGRFKGKTWEEMYDTQTIEKMRAINSERMCQTNEKLLNGRTSKIEKKTASCLAGLGFMGNIQVGKYIVDLYNKERNIVVEIYGDYWHANPAIYDADFYIRKTHMFARDKWAYDDKRIKYLENYKKCRVLIFWESNLNKDGVDIVRKEVEKLV